MLKKGLIFLLGLLLKILFFRIKKTEITLKMLNDFEQGFEDIRSWMDTVEANLQRPLTAQNANELRLHQQSITVSDLSDRENLENYFLNFSRWKSISKNIVPSSVVFLLSVIIYYLKLTFVHEISIP
jgi:hypothetical protein